jgi:hypothetical protein
VWARLGIPYSGFNGWPFAGFPNGSGAQGMAFHAWFDSLVVRERVRDYALIIVVMGSAALVVNAVFGHLPLTLSGGVVAPDLLGSPVVSVGELIMVGRAVQGGDRRG